MGLDDGTYTIRNRLHDTDLNTKDCTTDDKTSDATTKTNVFIYKVASKSATDTSKSSTNWTVATSNKTQTISTSITPSGGTATTYKTHGCSKHNRAEAYTDKSTGWTITPVTETTTNTTTETITQAVFAMPDGAAIVDVETEESSSTTTVTYYTIANGSKQWKLTAKTDGIISIEAPPTDAKADQSAFQFTFTKVS